MVCMTPPIDTKNPKEPSYNQSLFSIFQIMSREWQLIYPDESENIDQTLLGEPFRKKTKL